MTLWHYLLAFVIGSIITWIGAVRCAGKEQWGWAFAALVPFAAGAFWFLVLWTRMDWDSSSWDQEGWLLATEFVLLAVVWIVAIATWLAARHAPRPSERRRVAPAA